MTPYSPKPSAQDCAALQDAARKEDDVATRIARISDQVITDARQLTPILQAMNQENRTIYRSAFKTFHAVMDEVPELLSTSVVENLGYRAADLRDLEHRQFIREALEKAISKRPELAGLAKAAIESRYIGQMSQDPLAQRARREASVFVERGLRIRAREEASHATAQNPRSAMSLPVKTKLSL